MCERLTPLYLFLHYGLLRRALVPCQQLWAAATDSPASVWVGGYRQNTAIHVDICARAMNFLQFLSIYLTFTVSHKLLSLCACTRAWEGHAVCN